MRLHPASARKITSQGFSTVELLIVVVIILIVITNTPSSLGQSPQNSSSQNAGDPNRYVVIISGASGEPAYAKQFQQWTATLQATLLGRFGFPKDRVKLLSEKPDANAAPATADWKNRWQA